MEIIDVDSLGVSKDGDTFGDVAAEEFVSAGYMINNPVLLRFPDGQVFEGNQVLVTPKGMEWLKREVPLEIRDGFGSKH